MTGWVVLPPTITTTDYHTAGEPFRIVVESPVPIVGSSVAERRAFAIKDPVVQELRAVLGSIDRCRPRFSRGCAHSESAVVTDGRRRHGDYRDQPGAAC